MTNQGRGREIQRPRGLNPQRGATRGIAENSLSALYPFVALASVRDSFTAQDRPPHHCLMFSESDQEDFDLPLRQFTSPNTGSVLTISSDERSHPRTPGSQFEWQERRQDAGDRRPSRLPVAPARRLDSSQWGYPYPYPPPPPTGSWMTLHQQQWPEYYQHLPPPVSRGPPAATVSKPSEPREPTPPPPLQERQRKDPTLDLGKSSPHLEEPQDSLLESDGADVGLESTTPFPT